ncbi:MAG: tetratricopeptide repeat protein [Desulfohalobiaceae bacterium]|nr:tetratricopeptide repeat protein [Desulfohalobiaceae bacterium]
MPSFFVPRLADWLPFARKNRARQSLFTQTKGYSPPSKDTLSAISDLSQAVKNNPDAVEIYLALGNLYRSQGELERAIQMRHNLIVRPNLKSEFKARALFELGLDYRRSGFLERARKAFEQTREFIGEEPALLEELALLAAADHKYEQAADLYGKLGKPIPQAHYLVQEGKKSWHKGHTGNCRSWLNRAIRVYPGSVEAWAEKMILAYEDSDWDGLAAGFQKGLKKIDPDLHFLLLESLIRHLYRARGSQDHFKPILAPEAGQKIQQVISRQPPDLLLVYYGAWIQTKLGNQDQAVASLKSCCSMDPGFWPARVELLSLQMGEQTLIPEYRQHLEQIVNWTRQAKKFICRQCGLTLEQIFFTCPKCRSWHSISFLKTVKK